MAKLEEIRSEQTVELAGALARKKAAIDIREREAAFYGLHQQRFGLSDQVGGLRKNLTNAERYRQNTEERLADPEPDMLPPKLYQDKATIHPVSTK